MCVFFLIANNICSCHAGTINSWVVIFILPINSALNPILYTLTTSFFREQVELLLCRWQCSSSLMKDRKSLTSTTIYMGPSRHMFYHSKGKLPHVSYPDVDAQYGWCSRKVLTLSSTPSAFQQGNFGLQVGSIYNRVALEKCSHSGGWMQNFSHICMHLQTSTKEVLYNLLIRSMML